MIKNSYQIHWLETTWHGIRIQIYSGNLVLSKIEYCNRNAEINDFFLQITRCNKCNKSYPSRSALVDHGKSHSRDIECNICSKAFPYGWRLTQHMRTHEKGERIYICSVCNKGWVSIVDISIPNHNNMEHVDNAGIKSNKDFHSQCEI